MSRRTIIVIALLLVLAVFVVLVAPSVDLPATILKAFVYALILLLLLRLPFASRAICLSRAVPVRNATGPPLEPAFSQSELPLTLRC